MCFTNVPQVKRDKLDKRKEPNIFIGYSLTSKAYRNFQPDTRKILISRNVSFMENERWNWNDETNQQTDDLNQEELVDHPPVCGTGLLADIYQKCNVVVLELTGY